MASMTINKFFTTTFQVYRLTYTANKATYSLSHTFKGHLQQAEQQQALSSQLQPSLAYAIWCSSTTDVKLNDTLRVGAREYTVVGITENTFAGNNKHLELITERSDLISA